MSRLLVELFLIFLMLLACSHKIVLELTIRCGFLLHLKTPSIYSIHSGEFQMFLRNSWKQFPLSDPKTQARANQSRRWWRDISMPIFIQYFNLVNPAPGVKALFMLHHPTNPLLLDHLRHFPLHTPIRHFRFLHYGSHNRHFLCNLCLYDFTTLSEYFAPLANLSIEDSHRHVLSWKPNEAAVDSVDAALGN